MRTEFDKRAQTNIQLYSQLLASGYTIHDVSKVQAAYLLLTQLFAGQVRPDGRPFVCHLVGVGSILAMLESFTSTVIAGLLHSAYTHGDFGMGRGEITSQARAQLRIAVGTEIEQILATYSNYSWNPSTVANWTASASTLDADMRQIVVIRLADTLEDALDHALLLSSKQENPHREIPVENIVKLAEAFGHPRLGNSLRVVFKENEDGVDLTPLRAVHVGSHMVCPSSWREKVLPRLVRFVRAVRHHRTYEQP